MFLRHLFPLLWLLTAASSAWAQVVPGQVLVMLDEHADARQVVAELVAQGALGSVAPEAQLVSAPMRIWTFRTDPARDAAAVLRAVRAHPMVEMAQLDHWIKHSAMPNDPQVGSQWHHVNNGGSGGVADADIDSELAWNLSTGGTTVQGDEIVVCLVEAADLLHPDLAANAWTNTAEIDNNNIDDDGNGYVDDVRGWDPAAGNDNSVYGAAHGTQVAGMMGARGNNGLGVAGISWRVKIMPVAITQLTSASVIAAYTYPLIMRRRYNDSQGAQGAFVVAANSSWGIDQAFASDFPLWCAMYDTLGSEGVLSCVAAPNASDDLDVVGGMPAVCSSPYLISVTSTSRADVRTFGGYGAASVDLAAPGATVYTTTSGNTYGSFSGTSFATPLVTGTVALIYGVACDNLITLAKMDPAAGARAVRDAILQEVDPLSALANITTSGGRLNANNAVQRVVSDCNGYMGRLKLQAKAALQGPYNASTGLMGDALRVGGFIPLSEPYTAKGHVNVGSGGETTTNAVLSVTGSNAIVDWIRVELRSPAAPQSVLASAHGLLQRDGDIVAPDGVSLLEILAPPGAYHVVVMHRNHLACMTAAPYTFNTATVQIDLRSTNVPLYGSQAQCMVGASVRALWAGSVIGTPSPSGVRIKYTGADNDRDPILTAIGGVVPTQDVSGYYRADVNMDGVVRYTGTNNDRDIILLNIGGTVATAVRVEQLP
ncbi:MAG TPA: S8 family serine peptidase [Flavobacteriales bacterium]